MTLRLALDQNFPTPIIRALQASIVEVELRAVFEIDPRLSRLDDWELLLALYHHPGGYAGMITTDARMLSQAKEVAVLQQTGLSLIVADGAGHDPVRATGLVLTHLPRLAVQIEPGKARVWSLSAHTPPAKTPRDLLGQIAARSKISQSELYAGMKLDDVALGRNPLARP